jgi:8-oxo-dGTP diphosphatase
MAAGTASAAIIKPMPPIHVVAGILRDHDGRVLVAERPAGKHLAGLWEFPGGKSDPGEAPLDALRRELAEEIGIEVESARPLISVPWTYPEKRIVLDAWLVDAYTGTPHARETQALQWMPLDALRTLPMPPADVPIVNALRLPDRYLITPSFAPHEAGVLLDGIERECSAGSRLIQLRQPTWAPDEIARAAREANAICSRYGAELLLNASWVMAERLGLAGVHVPARVANALDLRPISRERWFAVSCHDAAEIRHATRIGADFVTLSPVAPTPSHPDAALLGWSAFAECAAEAAVPVYALGGLGAGDIAPAQGHGGQGVAAIRAFWR